MQIVPYYLHFLYLCKPKTENLDIMMKEIYFKIREGEDFIQLIQLLKASNVVESGGLAQILVMEGEVKRNGEVELRKRAKIKRGEKVEVQDLLIIVE